MKRIVILLVTTCCFITVSAQQDKMDSIRNILKSELTITERALKMKDLAMYCETVDQTLSVTYYNEAIQYALKNKLTYETAVIFQNKSYIYTATAEYKKSLQVLDSALIFLRQTDNPKKAEFEPKIYHLISANYRYLNDFKQAVSYQLKAISLFENLKMYTNLATAYNNLAGFYKETSEFEKQLDCGEKILKIAAVTKDNQHYFVGYFVKAHAYTNMNRYKEAAEQIKKGKQYFSESMYNDVLISFYLVSGLINMNLNKLNEAYTDFSKSLEISVLRKHTFSIVQSKMQIARVLTLQKKFSEAEVILKEQSKEIENSNEVSQKNVLLDYQSRLYEAWGKDAEALSYYKKYKELNDSIASEENKQFVSEMELKYETQKKDGQINLQQSELKRRKILNYIFIAAGFVMLLLAYLFHNTIKQKQKLQQQRINELETEKQLTATEAVLKGEEQERTRLAKDLHDGLGGMLSGIKFSMNTMKGNFIMTPENQQAFERSMDMLDSSIKEMRRVAHNMMPEALVKFGLDTALKDFCNEINQSGALNVNYQSIGMQDAEIDQTIAIAVYRIVQELINNTMKHASAKNSIVQLCKENNQLSVTVEDDGKGFNAEILKSSKGIGWLNIQNRVEFLKGKIDVNSAEGKGTSVLIEINV